MSSGVKWLAWGSFTLQRVALGFAVFTASSLFSLSSEAASRETAKAAVESSLRSAGRAASVKPATTNTGGGGSTTFDPANYFDNKELIRAPRAIRALDANLFGDQVNLYRGGLEFVQTDVSLEGSSKIPVAVTRRLTTGGLGNMGQGLFNEWDLEIPHIHGTFLTGAGWVSATGSSNQRCTNFGKPPDVPYTVSNPGWRAIEFWGGNMLTVPGIGTQEILRRNSTNTNIPSDGSATPLVTSGNWAIRCISTLASASGSTPYAEQGEGFLAIAPDGTKYRFDWLVSRTARALSKQSNSAGAHMSAFRSDVWILPTLITDRFGNTVTYTYDTTDKWKLLSITASDGRQVTFTYVSGSRRVQSVTDGTRAWTYTYDTLPANGVAPTSLQLVGVTLPDGSAWDFHGMSTPNGFQTMNAGLIFMEMEYPQPNADSVVVTECDTGLYMANGFVSVEATGSMTHPSGAVGTFTLTPMEHGRNGVAMACYSDGLANSVGKAFASRFVANFALTAKTITGPGLPSMSWSYSYDTWYPSWNDGSTWVGHVATVSVTDPNNHVTRHTFGNRYNVDEGKPLKVEVLAGGSTLLRTTTTQYDTTQFTAQLGVSDQQSGDGLLNGRYMPVKQVTTNQQGTDFTWLATSFDGYARPTAVTLSSSLGYSRSESTAYYDNTSLWVLGQIDTVTSGGLTVVDNDYNATTGTLSSTKRFGITQETYTYNTDGTLASRADGAGHTVSLSSYKLGIPQTVSLPTGASRSAVVNNIGLISSVTDEASYTTGFGYDAMGRLASVTPPSGFTATSLTFEKVSSAEYGLAAGHWRQTVSLGDARTVTYYDGMWRPVMTRTFDNAQEAATRKVTVKQFDFAGRPTYDSYPARDVAAYNATPGGVQTTYDALGRETQKVASSELGNLTTTTNYLSGFQTQVTNPRGKVSTSSFWALNDPSGAQLAGTTAPAGVNVSISRDSFGKPTAITRGGTFNGYTSSVTRRYVYDSGQRLCKTIEPEVGSTVQDYDAASNVAWKAQGQALVNPSTCEQSSVGAAAKAVYGYDNLNRLTSVTYGDGSPSISRTYTPDGMPWTVASNGSTWTYGYNSLRKLATESLSYAGQTYNIGWGYNTAGNLGTLTYPDGSTVSYSPNALGEATTISGYASGIAYHPNGAVAGYTLAGSGIVHSLTQNARGLPLLNADGTVLQDQYGYDANGNVTSITDLRSSPPDGSTSRTMSYDDLDRLASASAPGTWGSATYSYDPVDNLRTAVVGTRSSTFNFDANNQLASVVTGGASTSYVFNAQGNLTNKGGQSFTFDLGNRLTSSSLGGIYAYDGHGRRIKIVNNDGSTRIQVYSQAGQLLWAAVPGVGTGPTVPASVVGYQCPPNQVLEGDRCMSTANVPADVEYQCPFSQVPVSGYCRSTTTATASGYYICPPGYNQSGGYCDGYLLTPADGYYICPNGYTQSGGYCDGYRATPADGYYICPNGYTQSGGYCYSGSSSVQATIGYVCTNGGTLQGNECLKPDHVQASIGYYCSNGGTLQGNQCAKPEHVQASIGYACPNGGTLQGDQCVQVRDIPALQVYVCNHGGSLQGDRCIGSIYQAAQAVYGCPDGGTLGGSSCQLTGLPSKTTAYIYLAGKQIAEATNGATQYVHTDALGSPVAHTNSTATVLNRTRFEPYGYVASGTKPSPNTSATGFTGHVQDAETDLVYMQQRYYDPTLGRFLSADPLVTNSESAHRFARYAYAGNSPYVNIDPDGQACTGSHIESATCEQTGASVEVLSQGAAAGFNLRSAGAKAGAVVGGMAGAIAAAGCDIYSLGACTLANPALVGGGLAGGAVLGAMAGERIEKAWAQLDSLISRAENAGPLAVQYALVANANGYYPTVRGGIEYLNKGEVWKYGVSIGPDLRYPSSALTGLGLTMEIQSRGTLAQVLVQEKVKLISHTITNGSLPPGNRIFK